MVLADTDGDGISDAAELQDLGFDPEVDPVSFNPLVADIPRLGVVLRNPPVMHLILTDTLSVAKVFEVDRTVENAIAIDQSVTDSVVDSIELSQTTSNSTTFTDGVPGDPTLSFEIIKTMNEDVSFNSNILATMHTA